KKRVVRKTTAKKRIVRKSTAKKRRVRKTAKKIGTSVHGQLKRLRRAIKSRPIRSAKPKRKPARRPMRKAA
ncbi:MAG: hypothetical protein V3S44_05200, partial [Alphaproteobacteria bacterium]